RPFEYEDIPDNPEMDQWVREYFSGKSSVLEILNDLSACSTQNDLCEGVFSRLSERSPSAVVVTMKCLRRDEGRDLAEVYKSDLKVARYLMAQHDFREGVRARLIDKDDRPQWDPDSFEKAVFMGPFMPEDG
ncbi:MAG TPA: enoyl-CoA hydratase/isomerase family protein, partial [Desulfomonilia bacterium]|nr:enoyl-CoA hydratase/isomerase family protein [Desulfomonilia bacterium]